MIQKPISGCTLKVCFCKTNKKLLEDEIKRKTLIIVGILALIVFTTVGIVKSQPFIWRVYSNTQTYQADIEDIATGTYVLIADVHSGSNSCVIRQGVGGPVIFWGTTEEDDRWEITLYSQYSYHMGTDAGSLPIPGTCTWTLIAADSQPDSPGQ